MPIDPAATDWSTAVSIPVLNGRDLQLWKLEISSETSGGDLLSQLSEAEQTRANRIKHVQTRQQFVIGRARLRQLLGSFLGMEPQLVPLKTGPQGKPELDPATNLWFNIGHSRDTVLIALSREGPVGVDLEHVSREAAFMDIAQHSFTAIENQSLAAITDPAERRSAFYSCWCRKEAVIKADGRGLSLPMASFETMLLAEIPSPQPIQLSGDAGAKTFYIRDIPLGDEMAGCLATTFSGYNLRLLRFPPGY